MEEANTTKNDSIQVCSYHVEDCETEKQVVEDPVDLLARKLPDGDDVAKKSNEPDQRDEESLSGPLEIVDGNFEAVLKIVLVIIFGESSD